MPGYFISPEGDLEQLFVNDYAMIDQYANTGSLWSWGANPYGEVGDGTVITKSSPVQTISGGTNWKQVAGGDNHFAAIKTDGTLWTWGINSAGQLGDNSTSPQSSPVQTISGGTNWKQVSAARIGTAAIKTDGTLWSWGFNTRGQQGDGTSITKSSPVQTISGGTNWKQVSISGDHAAAVKTDGTLWLWGYNAFGQLGDGTSITKSSPVQTISGGTNWKQVSAGGLSSAAIKTDGTLWTWGNNSAGQLGNNTRTNTSSPVQTISGGSNWKQVSASDATTVVAIKTNGTLWGWGRNNNGQLGDNTLAARSSPVQTVSGGTNWKLVASGVYHSAAIKTDGTLWVWGVGATTGDNTGINRSSPVQTVSGGNNWKTLGVRSRGVAAIHFYDAGNLYPSS